ncbi:MAG TPA: glutamyl-tRNA reductase [Clostridiaceae bacterium]|nr:glutamyl-tRNA reductase [Clostridiaceae bacterium]
MLIFSTGINFQTAPLELRNALAVTDESIEYIAGILLDPVRSEGPPLAPLTDGTSPASVHTLYDEKAAGCLNGIVVVNTCNRLELYFTSQDPASIGYVQEVLCAVQGIDIGKARRSFYFYKGDRAVRHLIRVCCGLDSMLLGEDQILGQVKQAHSFALKRHHTDSHLNVMFRSAVTAAKAIKTATSIPAAPVSIASLAAKAALEATDEPSILLVGATGQTGTSVLKNLCAAGHCHIYATMRTRSGLNKLSRHKVSHRDSSPIIYQHPCLEWIDYEDRFLYLDRVDVVVSATSSPHYVFTLEDCLPHLVEDKPYLFIDIAVPLDIDVSLRQLKQVNLLDIDDFKKLSETNNRQRKEQSQAAGKQVEQYVDRFMKWHIYHELQPRLDALTDRISQIDDRIPASKVVEYLVYNVREYGTPDMLINFFLCLDQSIQQRYIPESEELDDK